MQAFQLFAAIVRKRLQAATVNTPPAVHTDTPIASLTQRSRIDISTVPIILARGSGSLIDIITGSNIVSAIGKLSLPIGAPSFSHPEQSYIDFYRLYLSQADGVFLHLAVSRNDPKTVLECRLYQPYHRIVPTSKEEWEFWLLDNPDPNVGGMIGCPIMPGKDDDGPLQYTRTWIASNQRIEPFGVAESIVDEQGDITTMSHTMMHYARPLTDPKLAEYLLVSVVETYGATEAAVYMWLGVDVDQSDLTAYPPG